MACFYTLKPMWQVRLKNDTYNLYSGSQRECKKAVKRITEINELDPGDLIIARSSFWEDLFWSLRARLHNVSIAHSLPIQAMRVSLLKLKRFSVILFTKEMADEQQNSIR
jgi:hypothetical protein